MIWSVLCLIYVILAFAGCVYTILYIRDVRRQEYDTSLESQAYLVQWFQASLLVCLVGWWCWEHRHSWRSMISPSSSPVEVVSA
jgi:hypothetical protein